MGAAPSPHRARYPGPADHILQIRVSDVEKHLLSAPLHSPHPADGAPETGGETGLPGMSHRHIAGIMNIDEKTVSGHKRCIMRKFNLSRTTDLHFWLTSHLLMSAQEKE